MDLLFPVFAIITLIFSVIIHEISHGYVALYLGDKTALRAGRLTLNPISHIDFVGSILVPLFLILLGGPVFGWAKPVPYDPRFLKNPKKGAGLIALAGPVSNLVVATVFSIVLRLVVAFPDLGLPPMFVILLSTVVLVNIALAVFNLIPIPPLDGSGVLFSFLPASMYRVEQFMRRYGFIVLLFLIFSGIPFLGESIMFLYRMFLGPELASTLGLF